MARTLKPVNGRPKLPPDDTIEPTEAEISAENSLLSAAVHGDRDAISEVIRLPRDVWTDNQRRELAEAFQDVIAEGKTPKPDELAAREVSLALIAELSGFGATSNPWGRAAEIKAAWERRDFTKRVQRLARMAHELSPDERRHVVVELLGDSLESSRTGPRYANVARWTEAQPPPTKWTFINRLPCGVTAGVAGRGGGGKGWIAQELVTSAAIGRELLTGFAPAAPMPVLALFGEDSEAEVWRRWRRIARVFNLNTDDLQRFHENAHLLCGWRAPFMRNPSAPAPTEEFEWLLSEVRRIKPGLIVIDPKSQFFGLEENSNDQTARWYANLTRCSDACCPPPSVLVCQHVSKARQDDSDDAASRGASANRDDARAFFSLTNLTAAECARFGVVNPRLFVKLEQTKSNYSDRLPDPLILQRQTDSPDTPEELSRGGVLLPIDAKAIEAEIAGALIEAIAEHAAGLIGANLDDLTLNDLGRGSAGTGFRAAIKDRHPTAKNEAIRQALKRAEQLGLLAVEIIPYKGGPRHIPRATHELCTTSAHFSDIQRLNQ